MFGSPLGCCKALSYNLDLKVIGILSHLAYKPFEYYLDDLYDLAVHHVAFVFKSINHQCDVARLGREALIKDL